VTIVCASRLESSFSAAREGAGGSGSEGEDDRFDDLSDLLGGKLAGFALDDRNATDHEPLAWAVPKIEPGLGGKGDVDPGRDRCWIGARRPVEEIAGVKPVRARPCDRHPLARQKLVDDQADAGGGVLGPNQGHVRRVRDGGNLRASRCGYGRKLDDRGDRRRNHRRASRSAGVGRGRATRGANDHRPSSSRRCRAIGS
jgi:hypothetical protein